MGLFDAVVIGLGSMIGAGIFAALAPAAHAAGSGLLLGLAVAAVVAYCNATSSARLAALYPASGGTYVYGCQRLGDFWESRFTPLAGVAIRRVIRHTLCRVARLLARKVRVGGRWYRRACHHVTGYARGAATRREMASVCAGAHVGMRYRCYGHQRFILLNLRGFVHPAAKSVRFVNPRT